MATNKTEATDEFIFVEPEHSGGSSSSLKKKTRAGVMNDNIGFDFIQESC